MCRRLNALASLAPGNKHSQVQGRAKGEGKLFAEEGPPRLQGGPKTSRANEALRRHLREGRPTEVHEIKLPLHREKDTCGCVSKNRTHSGPEERDGLQGGGPKLLSAKEMPFKKTPPVTWAETQAKLLVTQLSPVFCSLPDKFTR